jgi:hypothetical protein
VGANSGTNLKVIFRISTVIFIRIYLDAGTWYFNGCGTVLQAGSSRVLGPMT